MKHNKLFTLVLGLMAVLLFLVLLTEGRQSLAQRLEIAAASASVFSGSCAEAPRFVDESILEPETPVELKYERYPLSFVYFVLTQEETPIYSKPDGGADVLRCGKAREKLGYVQEVQKAAGDSGVEKESGTAGADWYEIYWYEDAEGNVAPDGSAVCVQKKFGYLAAGSAEKRRLRVDAMADCVKRADGIASSGAVTHVSNYKNGNGKPPAYHGQNRDAAGTPRSQSAPAYPSLENKEEFSYLEDGTLLLVLDAAVDECGNSGEGAGEPAYRRVMDFRDEKTYFVPLKYVPAQESLTSLTKAIVVDRKNQNEAAFEKRNGVWICVSCTMATTGADNQYASPTPLGYFLAMETRSQFYYYKDGTSELQGFAPYVLRFCGGAYIHGVPVSYQYQNGKRVKPAEKEYSSTMGTEPLSHKCVRNYTSHARFLCDWYEKGQTAVIVME